MIIMKKKFAFYGNHRLEVEVAKIFQNIRKPDEPKILGQPCKPKFHANASGTIIDVSKVYFHNHTLARK